MFCEQMTFGHLAGALHQVLEGLGGTARVWRVDRMATAVIPATDRLNSQFAQMAEHYGVDVAICPALDDNEYAKAIKVIKAQMDAISLDRHRVPPV